MYKLFLIFLAVIVFCSLVYSLCTWFFSESDEDWKVVKEGAKKGGRMGCKIIGYLLLLLVGAYIGCCFNHEAFISYNQFVLDCFQILSNLGFTSASWWVYNNLL